MLKYSNFPETYLAQIFKSILEEGYRRLALKHNIEVRAVDDKLKFRGWGVEKQDEKTAIISVGKDTLLKSINTLWPRAALHELAHIYINEKFDIDWIQNTFSFSTREPRVYFNLFITQMSPEGYLEFLADEVYMKYFPEPWFRQYFKPESTENIKTSFDELLRQKAKDIWQFANLFYIYRVNYTARKYNELRITHQNMLKRLTRHKRYVNTVKELDKFFSTWQFPSNRKMFIQQTEDLYKIFVQFIKS